MEKGDKVQALDAAGNVVAEGTFSGVVPTYHFPAPRLTWIDLTPRYSIQWPTAQVRRAPEPSALEKAEAAFHELAIKVWRSNDEVGSLPVYVTCGVEVADSHRAVTLALAEELHAVAHGPSCVYYRCAFIKVIAKRKDGAE